jgi:3',5'-cyclic-AMP phosphodiesterase
VRSLRLEPDEPVCYSIDLGRLRLVILDSTLPGRDAGELDDGRLEWLEAELAAEPERLTLIAMHHPPLLTGMPAWDRIGLADSARRTLGEVIEGHRQVRRIVAGHVHRTMIGELAGCSVLAVPSTYVQARLNLESGELEFSAEPPGFAVHTVVDGELISRVQSAV